MLPYLYLHEDFPPTEQALTAPDGLLCAGADLSPERLIQAYESGIFPWYNEDEPILWWSPSERMVLFTDEIHISKSFTKDIKKHKISYFLNRNFKAVIEHCAHIARKDKGTWIHPEMIDAYYELFARKRAFCLEVELNGEAAGGIYGVITDHVYCGESMYSLKTNGSKYALLGLCQHLQSIGIKLIDCQIHNPHLESMGAKLIPRKQFLNHLSGL
ncbi:leucyl/phenylalanyl-tRNA--protein transferase [Marinicella rhabdoformis]|uniref:leucyl/phenylalanyl-tRNA--protein transferase n=1 Tax=Marinicella rhabdoformis TaxID=2580566 RepID=UPI0012AEB9A7|nr:leucyl/phenylalanyl-tRNA--protein transferase [Marinicella rhabdoformis]